MKPVTSTRFRSEKSPDENHRGRRDEIFISLDELAVEKKRVSIILTALFLYLSFLTNQSRLVSATTLPSCHY